MNEIEERLRKLTLRAQVAFALRCAERVWPLVERRAELDDKHKAAIRAVIDLAAAFATATDNEGVVGVFACSDTAQIAFGYAYAAGAAGAGAAAARAAKDAYAATEAAYLKDDVSHDAAYHGAKAAKVIRFIVADVSMTATDLNQLETRFTTETRELGPAIDISERGPMGPLWSVGKEPEWWPKQQLD